MVGFTVVARTQGAVPVQELWGQKHDPCHVQAAVKHG